VTATPKTIQIFLPHGDPQGIRVAEITTRIVQVFDVPRKLLASFLEMDESAKVVVYFLLGEGEQAESPQVYVGQTGDLRQRLTSHHPEEGVLPTCGRARLAGGELDPDARALSGVALPPGR
jgi:hypothetical protein